MHMQGGVGVDVMGVMGLGQAFGQFALFMIIDIGEGRKTGAFLFVLLQALLFQTIAHHVADGLGAVGVVLFCHEFVELF